MTRQRVETRPPLLDAVKAAALAEGVEPHPDTRCHRGRGDKVELISNWGTRLPHRFKEGRAAQIADRLEHQGFRVEYDVLETGGFDVIFQLRP